MGLMAYGLNLDKQGFAVKDEADNLPGDLKNTSRARS